MTATLITFVGYILVMLGIGYYAFQQTNDSADYFLGGRKLGPTASALSAGASDMSGWLLLGLPGYAYSSGMESIWLSAGLLIGTYLNWLIVAPRLRVYSVLANDSQTIPAFLENRFGGNNKPLRVIFSRIYFVVLLILHQFWIGCRR